MRRGFLSFCGKVSRSRTRLTRKNSFFPSALRSVRNSRSAQSALTEKCGFRWRELNFLGAASRSLYRTFSMCLQHRNVCEAPLCGCMSKHFTRSFVAQRFKSAFHVFANAKTFHFCAEDTLAYCSLLSAQKFHVRSKGAQLRLMFIALLRRTLPARLF